MSDNDEFILEYEKIEIEDIIFDNSEDAANYCHKKSEIISLKYCKKMYIKSDSGECKQENEKFLLKNRENFYKTVEHLSKKNRPGIITWWVSWHKLLTYNTL